MSFPIRFSVTTFNLWGSKYWPERSADLVESLRDLKSDIFLFQEVTPAMLEFLDGKMLDYQRVQVDSRPGWTTECNMYWKSEMFTLLDEGVGDLDIVDHPNRGLFWVRLLVKANPKHTLFVSTVHFPWPGCHAEIEMGVNQRIPAAAKVCEHFRRLVPSEETAILGGDFNDDFHPLRILSEEMGLIDVFEYLDLPPPITHPVRPSCPEEEGRPNKCLDWIVCTLPSQCRVMAAFAKTPQYANFPPVSDHLPVSAIFELH
jgi:endonuclease/exonuclease/phosphatase family metal-dependent hydrolase